MAPKWIYKKTLFFFFISLLIYSCSKPVLDADKLDSETQETPVFSTMQVSSSVVENFESATKPTYVNANVQLATGMWSFDNTLIGTSASDAKAGLKAARIRNTGRLTMLFDLPTGVKTVNISSGAFSTNIGSQWELLKSTDKGTTWSKVGKTVIANLSSLQITSFEVNETLPVRFQIRKTTGTSLLLNIDDIVFDQASLVPVRDDNMALGNPSNATISTVNANNFLINTGVYSLSYNNAKGIPNWVSWHLNKAWRGLLPRPKPEPFVVDNTLPTNFYKVTPSVYVNTGFDRGHLCPSADRNFNVQENSVTYLMTNMMPQAPNNNQQIWGNLEDYCRDLVNRGNELYVIAGSLGSGGAGSKGAATSIANGKVAVPAFTWKIVLILPEGQNDINRISSQTKLIAVNIPNNQTVVKDDWIQYAVSVDYLEEQTGYDFLSKLPNSTEKIIESKLDKTMLP